VARGAADEAQQPIVPGRAPVDYQETNLDFFHEYADIFEVQGAAGFTKIRTVAQCCPGPEGQSHGKVELYAWDRHNGGVAPEVVAVKRVNREFVNLNRGRERNDRLIHLGHFVGPRRHQEDTLTEIGTYRYLFQEEHVPEYILRMHTVFGAGPDVWMVLELANSGDLFQACETLHGAQSVDTVSRTVMRWMWQLIRAVSYMHGRKVGHRDISLENVLLKVRDVQADVRLMDFGQAVRSHSEAGEELRYWRYFSQAGKDYYRPCNMYVPTKPFEMVAPANCRGGEVVFYPGNGRYFCDVTLPLDVVPGERCTVEPAGYHVRPADNFACGVCAFILSTGLPPWKVAHPSDQTFVYVCKMGVASLLRAWGRQLAPEAEDFIARAMSMDVSQRPTSEALLEHAWFEPIRRVGAEGT
jgi:serine/threonine protein kinase